MATSKNQYNIKAVLLFFFISINAIQLTAQDFHYSQFFNTPLTTNPGNTGVFNGDIRVYSMYRMQWFTVTTPYKTLSFAADAPIFKKKMKSRDFVSAGINVNNDNGICGANVSWTAPTASDNCSISSFTTNHAIGSGHGRRSQHTR